MSVEAQVSPSFLALRSFSVLHNLEQLLYLPESKITLTLRESPS